MWTNGRTEGRTEGRTDKASFRVKCPQLKRSRETVHFKCFPLAHICLKIESTATQMLIIFILRVASPTCRTRLHCIASRFSLRIVQRTTSVPRSYHNQWSRLICKSRISFDHAWYRCTQPLSPRKLGSSVDISDASRRTQVIDLSCCQSIPSYQHHLNFRQTSLPLPLLFIFTNNPSISFPSLHARIPNSSFPS